MALVRINIDVTESAGSITGSIRPIPSDLQTIPRTAAFLESIASGVRNGKVRVNIGAVPAEGSISFDSFVENDTVTVNGVVLTGKDAPTGAAQFLTGVDDQSTANALVALINASATAKLAGLVYATRRGTVLLSSFVTTNTVTVNGVVFTGKTTPTEGVREEFAIGASDALTAENLMTAIRRCISPSLGGLLSVSRSTATLTINYNGALTLAVSANGTATSKTVVLTALTGGQIGNLMTLAISAHGTKVDPTGGTEGTETVIGQNAGAGSL